MMDIWVIDGPESEPVTLEEAGLHLRVEDEGEDSIIASLITTAREYCESFTGKSLALKTYEYIAGPFQRQFDSIKMPMPPLKTIVTFKYLNTQGQQISLAEDIDYFLITGLEPGFVCPDLKKGWPMDCSRRPDAIRIRFTAGYDEVPRSIKQAMLLLIGHFYENREAVYIGSKGEAKELPLAVSSLLRPYWLPRW